MYEYDRGGNMTKRDQYAYTTADELGDPVATRTYGYNPQWKDQLTANGSYPLIYDSYATSRPMPIGNTNGKPDASL